MVISWLQCIMNGNKEAGYIGKVTQKALVLTFQEVYDYVVIDIVSQKHDYFMIQKETGVAFGSSSVSIPNSEEGYKKLHKNIRSFSGTVKDSDICIGLESTTLTSSPSSLHSIFK